MVRAFALLLFAALLTSSNADAQARPQRIVSTNYCTDQILLRLVEPERIASLTYLSWKPGETPPEYQATLKRLKQNHGLAEEILMLEPDLVIGGTFSSRFANALLQKLGKTVLLIEPENDFEGWYASIRKLGAAVGEPARAETMIADFQAGLANLRAQIPPGEMPIYADLDVNNFMPGKDTLYTQVVNAGGFRTAGEYVGFSGYQAIPVEQLIRIPVDLISTNSAYENPPSMQTQNLHHPLLRMLARRARAAIEIPGRYTTCTTPETLKMIEMLVKARKDVDAAKAREARG